MAGHFQSHHTFAPGASAPAGKALTGAAVGDVASAPSPVWLLFSTAQGRLSPKFSFTTKEAEFAIGSPRIFKRLRHHGWLKPLQESQDALYPCSRVMAVQQRMEAGEFPPFLPSEIKELAKRRPAQKPAA